MENLSCEQVISLLTFYIECSLTPKLMNNIECHLQNCEACREKYYKLKNIIDNYNEIKQKIYSDFKSEGIMLTEKEYVKFLNNLSAYIDNELDENDSIKIKQYSVTNQQARNDLENIINFRQLLQTSFLKTKNEIKEDYSAKVIRKIYGNILPKKNLINIIKNIITIIFLFITIILITLSI